MTAELENSLWIAQRVADRAAAVAMRFFQQLTLHFWHKPDGSRVTDADLATEEAIRTALASLAPGESVLAEESGGTTEHGERWIIDPIDGTENFSRGNPVWAVLIAKEVAGRVDIGVVEAPALGRRWWAIRGGGAFTSEGRRLAVSTHTGREDATFCYGGIHECPSRLALDRVTAVARQFRCAWGWGNFWGQVQVAQGSVDAAVSYGTEVWDVAAPALIVAEAGGRWSDVDGVEHMNTSLLTSNGALHQELVNDLAGTAG